MCYQTWNSGDKALTLELCKAALEQSPFDSFYLSMFGIASYYLAADSSEGDERQVLMEGALFSLRKALAQQKRLPVQGQVEYLLGQDLFSKRGSLAGPLGPVPRTFHRGWL